MRNVLAEDPSGQPTESVTAGPNINGLIVQPDNDPKKKAQVNEEAPEDILKFFTKQTAH